MRTVVALLTSVSLLLVSSESAALQRGSEGRAYVTLNGGLAFGGSLWSIDRQAINSVSTAGVRSVDTLALSRSLTAGAAFNFGGSYFPTAHLGLGFDVLYRGLQLDDDCRFTFDSIERDELNLNRGLCDYVNRNDASVVVIDFALSGIYRILPYAGVSPYLRAVGGASFNDGTVEMRSNVRQLIEGEGTSGISPVLGFAVGATRPTDDEVQFKWEIRYLWNRVAVVRGPADEAGNAPVEKDWLTNVSLLIGMDFVLK